MRKCVVTAILVGLLALPSLALATASFGDGIWRVGKDIGAGTYRSRGGNGCYWARLRSFGGGLNAIIANATPSGPTVVTLKRTDKGFETTRCSNWSRRLKRITESKTRFGEGTFIVGLDIAPGTYRSRGGSNCYWARLRNFTGELNGIIANGTPSGPTIVTISSSDRGFDSSRCGNWSRL